MERIKSFFKQKTNCVRFTVFILILILNILTPLISDDFVYSDASGFFDIFHKEYIQYMTWTGRSVAHIIDRFFLLMPKIIFDLANSVMFCIHVDLIALHAAGNREKVTPLLYCLITLAIFLCAPLFGQTILWETGACNYLWTTTIILAFLWQYRSYQIKETDHNPYYIVWMFLFGIVAGWTNENTGGACILMTILLMAYFRYQKKPLKPWMFSGLIGSVIGFVVMLIAPGNRIRSADFVSEGGKLYGIVHDLFNTVDVFGKADGQLPLWLAFAAVCGFVWIYRKNRESVILGVFYGLCGMASVAAIIISPVPVYFDRSMYGATIFVITGIAVMLVPLLEEKTVQNTSIITLSLMIILSVFNYGRAFVDLAYTRYQYEVRESWLKTQKAAGNLNPTVPAIYNEFFTTYNGMFGLNDILANPDFINNRYYSLINGFESITSTSLEKWNNLYRSGDPKLMNLLDMEDYLTAVQKDPSLVGIMTCTTLNEPYEPYRELLSSFMGDKVLNNASNFILTFSGTETDIETNETPFGKEVPLEGHYVWVSSEDDPTHTDIVIDGMEYTNDLEGISIVVFDKEQGSAVDSVTWNTDYGMRGQRSYIER